MLRGRTKEDNDSQAINRNSLSRKDIAAMMSSVVNNDCGVINDFSVKLNIRRGFCFEDFVKAFKKNGTLENEIVNIAYHLLVNRL